MVDTPVSPHAALYIRVSTHDQEELSPDSQKRLLLDYASAHGFLVSPVHIYQENGISGRSAEKRPAFQHMIADAKSQAHPFDVILVWKFSRFARNQEESIVYKSMLRKNCHVDVVSISEPLSEGPFGSLIERIIEWMDEFYSIRLSGDVIRGMTEKALRGGFQGRPPYGYRIPYPGSLPEIVPQEATVIQSIFEDYVQNGKTISQISASLHQCGILTARGTPFEKRAIRYILENPFYAGNVRWNRTESSTSSLKPQEEWIIRPGNHTPIISQTLFQQAQHKLENDAVSPYSKPPSLSRHWLSGLLKCPFCGSSLVSCIRHRKTMADTYSFQCGGYLKGKCLHSCYAAESLLAPAILAALSDLLKTAPDVSSSLVICSPARHSLPASSRSSLLASLKRLEQKELRAREAYLDGIDSKEEYAAAKERFRLERDSLNRLLESSNSCPPDPSQVPDLSGPVSLPELLGSPLFSMEQKNTALKSIVRQMTLYRDSRHLDVFLRL